MKKIKAEFKWWWQRFKNIYHFIRAGYWIVRCGYPAKKLTVIGVTGTDGKTTTSTLIYEILKEAGFKVDYLTTVNSKGLHTTNPDAKDLQPILLDMLNRGITHVVLEVTAHGLDQYRVMGCNFRIGVLTNISHEHLDDFVDMPRYMSTKLKLFMGVKYAVLNLRDQGYEYFKRNISEINPDAKILSYKESKIAKVSESLLGDYNLQNIGAAETVADILGVNGDVVRRVVGNFKGVLGRRQEVALGQTFRVIVDFAHTPNAMRAVLSQLKKELKPKKKLLVVFGATGGRDQTKRPMMGSIADELADVLIVTSDDTRSENQDQIYSHIATGVKNKAKLVKINDRREAIRKAFEMANPGDIVLLAGKGHEKSILLENVEYEWSDYEEAKRAIMG